ncbi:hypothetical protein [Achromobacter spanius]|uniref:hypothetical protein n=1 Tax=Achromobacter spanius TaxID=217203 RepID=UPI003821BD47
MQTFKDTVTGEFWQFDDDVLVADSDGVLVFTAPYGAELVVPRTLIAAEPPPPTEPQAPTPMPVSRWQGREAMRMTPYGDVPLEDGGTSLFDATVDLLARPETPMYYRTAWDELQMFDPDSPMLSAIAETLGLAAADLRSLFLFAATLKA